MKRWSLIIGVFFLLLRIPATPLPASQEPPGGVQGPGKGVIEGVVLDAASQPLEDAQLILTTSWNPVDYSKSFTTFSGPDGKFSFKELKPDSYTLAILANGYVRQSYGGKAGEKDTIKIDADQWVQMISVTMTTETGTVSGRVEEIDTRKPLSAVPVRLVRLEYRDDGQRTLRTVTSAKTNDRGEYRLFYVTPGRYFINAGGRLSASGGAPILSDDVDTNEVPVVYRGVYYPGVQETREAVTLEVNPGSELGGIDFRLSSQGLYRIRGKVLDSRTGQPPTSSIVSFSLSRRAEGRGDNVVLPSEVYRRADGSFEIPDLTPGSYLLAVTAFQGGLTKTSPPRPLRFATNLVPVDIVDADIGGIVVQASLGESVSGSVVMENQEPLPSGLENTRVFLAAAEEALTRLEPLMISAVNSEASFRFENITPAEYWVSVRYQPGVYIKEARFGPADALRSKIRIGESENRTLQIILSSRVAKVEGVVKTDRLDPAPDRLVVIMPERERDRFEVYAETHTDSNGKFEFPNLAPGAYRLFAWDSLQENSYFDPEVQRRFEQRGTVIQLRESAKESVTLTLISETNR